MDEQRQKEFLRLTEDQDNRHEHTTIIPHSPVDYTIEYRAASTVLNVFWAIFIGIPSVIYNAILGVVLCCTIIGIPAGIKCFKFIPLIFAPAGRQVRLYYGRHKFWNTVSFIFGGFENYTFYLLFGLILCVTIIGIPFAKQMFKVANFHLAPYGLEVVYGNSYTQNRDHQRDLLILESQIFIDNKEINLSDKYGTFQTNARDVIKNIALSREEYITYCKGFPSKRTFVEKLGLEFAIISAFSALFAILLVIARLSDPGFYQAISIVVVIVSVLVGIFLILMLVVDLMTTINISKAMKLYKARLIPLTTYYPMQVDEKYALMSRSVLN